MIANQIVSCDWTRLGLHFIWHGTDATCFVLFKALLMYPKRDKRGCPFQLMNIYENFWLPVIPKRHEAVIPHSSGKLVHISWVWRRSCIFWLSVIPKRKEVTIPYSSEKPIHIFWVWHRTCNWLNIHVGFYRIENMSWQIHPGHTRGIYYCFEKP